VLKFQKLISVRCSSSIYDSIIPIEFYTLIYESFFYNIIYKLILFQF